MADGEKRFDERLFDCARDEDVAGVRAALRDGANVNWVNPGGRFNALHLAAQNGHEEVATVLIEAGATVNARSSLGHTPLHIAAWHGHAALIAFLLRHGADRTVRNTHGNTPEGSARRNNKLAVWQRGVELFELQQQHEAEVHARREAEEERARRDEEERRIVERTEQELAGYLRAPLALLGRARAARGETLAVEAGLRAFREWPGGLSVGKESSEGVAAVETELLRLQSELRNTDDPALVAQRDTCRRELIDAATHFLEVSDALDVQQQLRSIGAVLAVFPTTPPAKDAAAAAAAVVGVEEAKEQAAHALDVLAKWREETVARLQADTERSAANLQATVEPLFAFLGDVTSLDSAAASASSVALRSRRMDAVEALVASATAELDPASGPPTELLLRSAASARVRLLAAAADVQVVRELRTEWRVRVEELKRVVAEGCPPVAAEIAELQKRTRLAVLKVRQCRLNLEAGEAEGASEAELKKLRRKIAAAEAEAKGLQRAKEALLLRVCSLASRDFPELLHRLPELRLGEVFATGGLFHPELSLASFTEVAELTTETASAHRVLRARWGEQPVVLKEFSVASEAERRGFLREARRLQLLAHPCVVEVRALFFDDSADDLRGFLVMPLYPEGDLREWVARSAPAEPAVQRVLRCVVQAVAHLHAQGVVHRDVKPENVFVWDGREGIGVLGDFDVSVDTAARTATLAKVGGTLEYLAPELLRNEAASFASDVFSLALTIFDALFRDVARPTAVRIAAGAVVEVPEMPGGLTALLQQMLAVEPRERPTAVEVLTSEYFAVAQRDPVPPETRECCVCLEEESLLADGLECGEATGDEVPAARHFLCAECLTRYVQSCAEELKPQVVCPFPGCEAHFAAERLAQRLPRETFDALVVARVRLAELEKDVEWEARLAAERRRLEEESQAERVQRLREQVVEIVLNLRCPRCRQVFVDFKDCAALTCSRPGCRCGFCAFCGMDCGDDAHSHVAHCRDGVGDVFVRRERWEAQMRDVRKRRVREFLARLESEELRTAVRAALERDLADLGLLPL